jgi:hypothetical protein
MGYIDWVDTQESKPAEGVEVFVLFKAEDGKLSNAYATYVNGEWQIKFRGVKAVLLAKIDKWTYMPLNRHRLTSY